MRCDCFECDRVCTSTSASLSKMETLENEYGALPGIIIMAATRNELEERVWDLERMVKKAVAR